MGRACRQGDGVQSWNRARAGLGAHQHTRLLLPRADQRKLHASNLPAGYLTTAGSHSPSGARRCAGRFLRRVQTQVHLRDGQTAGDRGWLGARAALLARQRLAPGPRKLLSTFRRRVHWRAPHLPAWNGPVARGRERGNRRFKELAGGTALKG